MMKCIFYILLGIFLVSKTAAAFGDIKECKAAYTVCLQSTSEILTSMPETDFKQPGKGVHNGDYGCKAESANSGNTFLFRCASPSKFLRNNVALATVKMGTLLKILLPEEKEPSFSFTTTLFNCSSQYYVYTLRRILI